LRAADTSLVVAAFASRNHAHDEARRTLDDGVRLVEHCALETYSVLTRLPAPHRGAPAIAQEFLRARFPQTFLRLPERAYRDFVLGLADAGIAGAAYDALVAMTAASHDAELVTCDKRAVPVYERCGVRLRLLG